MSIAQALIGSYNNTITLTHRQNEGTSTNATSLSGSSVPLGTASSLRYVVVAIHWSSGGSVNLSTLTVTPNAGVPVNLTLIEDREYLTNYDTALYGGYVPTGTTATVTASFSGTFAAAAMSIYTIDGLTKTTPADTDTATGNSALTCTVDIPAGAVVISAFGVGSNVARTHAWTGLTEDFDGDFDNSDFSTASDKFTSAESAYNITCTPSTTNITACMVAAVFEP